MPVRHRDDPAHLLAVDDGLVGRARELDRTCALLVGSARLVTLIGSGGIGKTKLAEEAARRVHRARRTPVFRVRLARLPRGADAAAVREAITGSVLVGGFTDASAWDGVVAALSAAGAGGRIVDTLLVLDNCEHVLAGAGPVVADLLNAAPGLTIVATSRQPIGWIDEQLVAVPPLPATQSLQLFRQCAELAGQPITDPGQITVARKICRRLHGNPLYIRLAAARMLHEPLPMILQQLSGESGDARMQWSHGPQLGVDDRHRSITDVIAWSYALCADKQRLLFDRLSVFAPGYEAGPTGRRAAADIGADLAAIEAVCADDVAIEGCDATSGGADHGAIGLARSEIRELLEQLAEKSLVSIHMTSDEVHYFLLESLRLFASERLAQRCTAQVDEAARLARRHRCYYRNQMLQAHANWFGPAQPELLNWAFGAWSNLRRAIDTSLHSAGQPVVGLHMAGLLATPPFLGGSLTEICSRIERALAATQTSRPPPTELRVAALAKIAFLAVFQGRPQDVADYLERCAAACGAPAGCWRDQPDTDMGLPAAVDYAWGVELLFIHRDRRSIAVLGRAREKFHSIADRGGAAMSEMHQALAAGFYGSAEQAMMIADRHFERTTAARATWARSWAQLTLAIALTNHGDAREALQLARAALTELLAMGDDWTANWAVHVCMWSLARLLTDQIAAGGTTRSSLVGPATEIAYLAGGAATLRGRLGVLIATLGPFADATESAENLAREVLGPETYILAQQRGAGLSPTLSEVQRLALGTLPIEAAAAGHPANHDASSIWPALSEAEREVAILAAAGWSNSAIGARRGTSTRTVDAQITSILEKMMIISRRDIAGLVPENQRDRVLAERSRRPSRSGATPRPFQSRHHR